MYRFLTGEDYRNLVANFARCGEDGDPPPVGKLFTPDAQATWLLTELDPVEGIAFGLCDLGLGFPELGTVSLEELKRLRGKLGLPIERDNGFTATAPLSAYADAARAAGRILSHLPANA